MQSRILSVVAATYKVPRSTSSIRTWVLPDIQADLRRGLASARAGLTVDPVVTTGDPEDPDNVAKENTVEEHTDTDDTRRWKGTESVSTPKPPYACSRRLESTGVNQQPLVPTFLQKRSLATATATPTTTIGGAISLEDLSCAGLEGSPWPKDKEKEQTDREEQQEDEQEYYKHHKASPLSEIKVCDTRKPITRATDGTADAGEEYVVGRDAIVWRPEQLDTAEEALLRASRIWKENAMLGDPDAPQSSVLRQLLRARGDSVPEYLFD
ncbi:hypothetical protein M0R45_001833 [Rubus argutus]|uniref:Uncharacterized protein n=1 Tax=Rubus argutus TaxID=59490 RepID=A0AAW1VFN2_RUBAR